MVQQRLGESDTDYKKRKRRVKLSMMVGANSLAHGGGSSLLAAIIYNMDTFNITAEMTRTIDNAGSYGAVSDADMYASNAVYFNGIDQYADLDIVHQLGADTKQIATLGTDWVDNGLHSYTATLATSSLSALSTATTDNVQISFTISSLTAGTVEGYSVNGTYTVDVTDDSLDAIGFTGDVLINSVKEITVADSFLTFIHPDTQEVETIASADNAEKSSKELVVNGDFSDGLNGWSQAGGAFTEVGGIVTDTGGTPAQLYIPNFFTNLRGIFNISLNILTNPSEKLVQLKGNNILVAGTQSIGVLSGIFDSPEIGNLNYVGNSAEGVTFTNFSVNQVLPISTTYRMEQSFSNAFMTDVEVTQTDRDIIKQYPECVVNMWRTDTNPRGLSFTKANIKHLYLGNTGGLNGDNCHDLVNATDAPIINATTAVWTTYLNTNKGLSNLRLKQGVNGIVTDVADDNTIEFNGDSRYANTKWVPSHNEDWFVECIVYLSSAVPTTNAKWFKVQNSINTTIEISRENIVADRLNFTLWGNSGSVLSIPTDQWYHIVMTTGGVVYVNSIGQSLGAPTKASGTETLQLGVESDTHADPAKDPMSIFKVHKEKEPTQARVDKLYNDAVAKGYL